MEGDINGRKHMERIVCIWCNSGYTETDTVECVCAVQNFKYDTSKKLWTGTLLGATSGGTKFTIAPEITNISVDGVLVNAKGLVQKVGETAKVETNMVELTKEWLKATTIGQEGMSVDETMDVIESKATIEDSDYVENFACVGYKTNGTPVIVLFDYALCTSGLSADTKNKEASTIPTTFDCYADLKAGAMTNVLPYHIYMPKEVVESNTVDQLLDDAA